MDIDDKELFSSAMADDQIPEVADTPADPPATEAPQQDGQARDEHGRFVSPKGEAEPAPEPEPQQPPQAEAKDNAHVPPWRLREIKEERDAINQRYLDTQRQLEMLRQSQPKPEPKPVPDLFENPNGFVDHSVQERLSPIEQRLQAAEARLQAQLEANSRRDAFREYGQETVRTAYDWIAQGIQARDPDVVHAYNRAMQSDHPFETIVQAHKRISIMQQIQQVGDLDKWAVQRAQELSGQPQQQQQVRQPSSQPQGSIVKLPPSLSRLPASQVDVEDESDTSDAALFRHAMR